MEMWKKVLICIGILLFIYIITVVYKFSVLSKIYEKNSESSKITNRYYISETERNSIEFWQKENIFKQNLNTRGSDKVTTIWKDKNSGETYTFSGNTYRESGDIAENLSYTYIEENPIVRLVYALNPLLIVTTKNYNNADCYCLKTFNSEDRIEKEKGLLVYTKDEDTERTIKYSFNTVTDEDVALPNLDEYTLD